MTVCRMRTIIHRNSARPIGIAAPKTLHLEVDEWKNAVGGNVYLLFVLLPRIVTQRQHYILPIDQAGVGSGECPVLWLRMAFHYCSPLCRQRIRLSERRCLPSISRQVTAIVERSAARCGRFRTIEIVGLGYAIFRLPVSRAVVGILPAQKPAEIGNICVVKSLVSIVLIPGSRALIAKIDLVEEQPVHAAVDLHLPDADKVLPVSRGCQAAAVEFHRRMKHRLARRIA